MRINHLLLLLLQILPLPMYKLLHCEEYFLHFLFLHICNMKLIIYAYAKLAIFSLSILRVFFNDMTPTSPDIRIIIISSVTLII